MHIFLGLHDGNLFYSVLPADDLASSPTLAEHIALPAFGLVLSEPVVKLKPEFSAGAKSLYVCKGASLFELALEPGERKVSRRLALGECMDSIYGFTKIGERVYGCSLSGFLSETTHNAFSDSEAVPQGKKPVTKLPLGLIREAYGVTKSSNGLMLYLVGKGRSEKETKPVLESFVPEDYVAHPDTLLIQTLHSAERRISWEESAAWESPVDVTDLAQLVMDDCCRYVDVVEILKRLQEEVWDYCQTETKENENASVEAKPQYQEWTETVKRECQGWNERATQVFLAKFLYQALLLVPGGRCGKLLARIEYVIIKEYLRYVASGERHSEADEDEEDEGTTKKRLASLFVCLAGPGAAPGADRELWKQLTKSASAAVVKDTCAVCNAPIQLFSAHGAASDFFKEGERLAGTEVLCRNHHKNCLIMNEMRIKRVGDRAYECSKCRCVQYRKESTTCFVCGAFCYKMP